MISRPVKIKNSADILTTSLDLSTDLKVLDVAGPRGVSLATQLTQPNLSSCVHILVHR